MKDLFVPYEIAVQLKELGFNEPCLAIHSFVDGELNFMYVNTFHSNDDVNELSAAAPTFSQAFEFFRDKHNLLNIIDCYISTPLEWFIRIDKISNDSLDYKMDITEESEDKVYLTYKEAELVCLGELIKIIKNKI